MCLTGLVTLKKDTSLMLRLERKTCENLIIYTPVKDIHTYMHKGCSLLVCLFALSPPEGKKRRQVKGAGGGC